MKSYIVLIFSLISMSFSEDLPPSTTRDSPGIFGFLNKFKKRKYTVLFSILFFLFTGLSPFITHIIVSNNFNLMYIIRNGTMFLSLVYAGTIASLFFKKRSPVLEFDLAFLINLFGAGFFFLVHSSEML